MLRRLIAAFDRLSGADVLLPLSRRETQLVVAGFNREVQHPA